jgi:hypothetical protein
VPYLHFQQHNLPNCRLGSAKCQLWKSWLSWVYFLKNLFESLKTKKIVVTEFALLEKQKKLQQLSYRE